MFSYTKEQTVYELGDMKVGGLPGEHPTLMVGTLFYEDEFTDPREEFDQATNLINKQNNISDELAINSIVDIFIYEEDEIEWKLDFAVKNIDGIFSLDIPDSEVRIKTLRYLDDIDELDSVIYNSLNLGVTDEELEMLEKAVPKGIIVLGYNPQNNSAQGRLDIIKDGGNLLEEGLLEIAKRIGVEYAFLDTAATPFGEGASETLRSVPVFKSEFGLPVGCAMHNTIEAWKWLNNNREKNRLSPILDTSIDSLPVLLGADFIYYGPIENAVYELTNIAMVDKLVAEGAEEYFGTKIDEKHPHHKLR